MKLWAILLGFLLDCLLGDPRNVPHCIIYIGKLISFMEKGLRKLCPKTKNGETLAGVLLWFVVVALSGGIPWLVLKLCYGLHPYLGLLVETLLCWQVLAARSLMTESMKVYTALKSGDLEASRYAVSMIVGRDTKELTMEGVTKATVETIAENTADGVIAPLLFLAIGGAPLGLFYKAVNTMDSMLGYVEPPYKNIGHFPAKMDDYFNYLPARLSAIWMLLAGAVLKLNVKNGWKIFRRDRYQHASPNSAQTESVCAGLLGVQLAGDASYHGVLHKKPYIGDKLREISAEDIPGTCRLMYVTTLWMLLFCVILMILL